MKAEKVTEPDGQTLGMISKIESTKNLFYMMTEPDFLLFCYDETKGELLQIETVGQLMDFCVYQDEIYYLTSVANRNEILDHGFYVVCCGNDGSVEKTIELEIETGWTNFEICNGWILYSSEDIRENTVWLRRVKLDGSNDQKIIRLRSPVFHVYQNDVVMLSDVLSDSGEIIQQSVPIKLSGETFKMDSVPFEQGAYFDGDRYVMPFQGNLADGKFFYYEDVDRENRTAALIIKSEDGTALCEIMSEATDVFWYVGNMGIISVFYLDGNVKEVWYIEKETWTKTLVN